MLYKQNKKRRRRRIFFSIFVFLVVMPESVFSFLFTIHYGYEFWIKKKNILANIIALKVFYICGFIHSYVMWIDLRCIFLYEWKRFKYFINVMLSLQTEVSYYAQPFLSTVYQLIRTIIKFCVWNGIFFSLLSYVVMR